MSVYIIRRKRQNNYDAKYKSKPYMDNVNRENVNTI